MRFPAKAALIYALLGAAWGPATATAYGCTVSAVNPVYSGPVVQRRPGNIDGQGYITVRCDPLVNPAMPLPPSGVLTATIRLGPGNSGTYRERHGGSAAFPGPVYNLYVDSGRQAASVFGDGMTDGTQSAVCAMNFAPNAASFAPSTAPQSCTVPVYGRVPGGQNPDSRFRQYDDTVPIMVTFS